MYWSWYASLSVSERSQSMNLIAGSSVKFLAMTSVALVRYSGMAVSYLYDGWPFNFYDLCQWQSLFVSAYPCPS